MTLEERIESARALRAQGYNCAQCVMAVFPEVHGLPQDVALRLSTGLGGGVGGSQNICGVLSSVALLDGSRTQGHLPTNVLSMAMCRAWCVILNKDTARVSAANSKLLAKQWDAMS